MSTQSVFATSDSRAGTSRQLMLWTLLFLLVLGGFALVWGLMNPRVALTLLNKTGGMQVGESLAGRSLPDLEGRRFALDQFRSREFVVMFSNAECQVCKQTYPILNQLQQRHPQLSVVIVGTGTKNQFLALRESDQIRAPILLNDLATSPLVMPRLYPMFYRVDGQGMIKEKVAGLDEAKLAHLMTAK